MPQIFDDRDVEILGDQLKGRTVDFVVSGGIACIESPRLVRELRRYGAHVRVFMTPSATKFVSPTVFEWASKHPVVTELSGSAEHISKADAIVVAPCTLDFLTKISLGIADTAAATLVQSALTRLPVLIAPSMHTSLSSTSSYLRHRKELQKNSNVIFLEPDFKEAKAKMISIEEAGALICHYAGRPSNLRGKRIVISAGPTRSQIDDVRFISNHSTGALGLKIAEEFYRRGAEVHCVLGPIQVKFPQYIKQVSVMTNSEMKAAFQGALKKKTDIAVFAAAVLDFEIQKPMKGKSTSKLPLEFKLKPSAKLIDSIDSRGLSKVGFKLESRISENELLKRAQEALRTQNVDVLIANRLEDVQVDSHKAYFFAKGEKSAVRLSSREEIAQALAAYFELKFESKLAAKSARNR